MIQPIINTFSNYPIQVIGLIAFVPILIILVYDSLYNRNHQLEKRVKNYLNKDKNDKLLDVAVEKANQYLGSKGDNIQLKLDRANIRFKKEEYLTILVLGVAGGAAFGFIIFPFGGLFKAFFSFISTPLIQIFFARILASVAFGALGYLAPEVWIRYLVYDRKRLLDEQIEDALLQIADALRSGAGITTAIKIAANELRYPMKDEFSITSEEMIAGKPFNDAINDLKERVDLKDFSMAMSGMQIQYETGAELDPFLRDIVKIIGDRKILKKEVQKAITESKGTGMILMIAPILFVSVFSSMNSQQYTQMFHSGTGIIMLILAIGSYAIGSLIILKIIRDISKLS